MKFPNILNIGILSTTVLLTSCVSTTQVNNDLDRQILAVRGQLASEQRKSVTLADEKAKLEQQKKTLVTKAPSPERDAAIVKTTSEINRKSKEEADVKREIAKLERENENLKRQMDTY